MSSSHVSINKIDGCIKQTQNAQNNRYSQITSRKKTIFYY